jgi:sortase A
LENGDTFMIQKNGKRYIYRIFDKRVISPKDVSVLNNVANKPATFTLITCDPPGTNVNRLIVIGEQISPDPYKNTQSSVKGQPTEPVTLPGNSESLWHRLTKWINS